MGMLTILATCLALVAADQLLKMAAVIFLQQSGPIEVIPNVLGLTYVENRGAAFGMMEGSTLFICHHNIYILSLIFPAKLSVSCTIYVPKNSFFLNLTATFTRTNIITITISGYIIFTPKFKPTLYV